MYDKEMIMEATNDLDELCRIGDSMYKATMYGEVLAIKRTNKDVKEELSILEKVNRVHLVNLMGIFMMQMGIASWFMNMLRMDHLKIGCSPTLKLRQTLWLSSLGVREFTWHLTLPTACTTCMITLNQALFTGMSEQEISS